MKFNFSKSLILIIFYCVFAPISNLFSQGDVSKCGTMDIHNHLMATDAEYKMKMENLEKTHQKRLEEYLHDPNNASQRTGNTLTIPVVVHVLETANFSVPDQIILQAIQQLNDIYSNKNGLGVDIEVNFCLAQRDPLGNPVNNGILHVDCNNVAKYDTAGMQYNGSANGASEAELKGKSKWNNKLYYNIWVVNFIQGGWAGFAYFPGGNNTLDGMVIDDDYLFGNTLAHEIGHALNLYHTFEGDGGDKNCPPNLNCNAQGDFICDTPPHKQKDCGAVNPCTITGIWDNSRFNYMSYCGNTDRFTQGQKDRMRVAFLTSRKSLITSEACLSTQLLNEIGLIKVLYPNSAPLCSDIVVPKLFVKNFGKNDLVSTNIKLLIDGIPVDTFLYTDLPGKNPQNDTLTITFDPIVVTSGTHTIRFEVLNVNNSMDEYDLNNYAETIFNYIGVSPSSNFCIDFNNSSLYDEVKLVSLDKFEPDTARVVGCDGNPNNVCMAFKSFKSLFRDSTTSDLYFKSIDLTNTQYAQFSFDISMRQDRLCGHWSYIAVDVSKDCGVNWKTLYYKNDVPPPCNPFNSNPHLYPDISEKKLFTKAINFINPPPYNDFYPSSCADWRTDTVNLSEFAGGNIQVRMRVVMDSTGGGENIFLDNFCFYSCNIGNEFSKVGSEVICFGENPNLVMKGDDKTPGLTYTWTKNGVDIPNQVSSTYTATNIGTYQLKTSNGSCSIQSEPVVIKFQDSCIYSPRSNCLEEQYIKNKGRFDIHYANNEFGYVCSDAGTIFSTQIAYHYSKNEYIGNELWQQMSTETNNHLYGIHVVDTSYGLAVGEAGTILQLDKQSWVSITTNPAIQVDLNDVAFADKTNGWIVGNKGNVYKLTKALNFTSRLLGTDNLMGVNFANANVGWIVGENGASYKTTDAGVNWTKTTIANLNWKSVYFVSVDTGWVVSDQNITYKTVNGGSSWTIQNQGIYQSLTDHLVLQPKTPSALATKNYYLNFGGSTLNNYSNAGNSFNQFIGFEKSSAAKLIELKGTIGYNESKLILESDYVFSKSDLSFYAKVQNENIDVLIGIQELVFTDPLHGFAVGSPGLYMFTTDGGITWNKQIFITSLLELNAIKFTSPQNGYIVGNFGTIFRTTNGGNNWSLVSINGSYNLHDIDASSNNYIHAVGSDGYLLESLDGGNNWAESQIPPKEDIYSISNPKDSLMYAVGINGYIYKYEGGGFWRAGRVNSHVPLVDVCVVNNLYAFTVGGKKAYKTFDGGQNWFPMLGLFGFELNSIKFVNRDTGFVTGSEGSGKARLLKSTNIGENWIMLNPGSSLPLRGVYIDNNRDGWAGGNQFDIIKINRPGFSSRIDTICNGNTFTLGSGHGVYSKTGIYRDTFNDIKGCDSLVTINLYVRPSNTIKATNTTTLCIGDSVGLYLPNNQILPNTTYKWTYNGSIIPNQTNSTITVKNAGDYQLQVYHGSCYVSSDTIHIDTLSLPKPKILGNPFTCQGEFTILEIENIYPNFTWSNGKKTTQIAVNTPGVYAITVTGDNGCFGKDSVNVQVGTKPTPTISGALAICQGVGTTLDAGKYSKYIWSTNDTIQKINVTTAGSYSVTVTNSSGCTGETIVEVTEEGTPDPDFDGFTTFCEGKSTLLKTINGPFTTYKWSSGQTTPDINVTSKGIYTVTVTSSKGCIGIDSIEMNELPAPRPELGDSIQLCDGKTITLTPGSGFNTYLWNTGENTESINVTTSDNYSVTVTNDFGCDAADTISVQVGFKPNPDISGVLAICEGTKTKLTAKSGFINYLWSTSSTEDSIIVTTKGNYSVTVTDKNGCIGSQQVSVTESPSPKPAISGNLNICEGAKTDLNAGLGYSTYIWNNGIKTQLNSISTGGDYSVTVTNTAGCSGVASVTVNSIASPIPQISGVLKFCSGDKSTLDAGSGFTSYSWTGGTSSQTLDVTKSGTYIVTVSNSNNCKGYDTVDVVAHPLPNPNIKGILGICEGEPTTLKADTGFVSYVWTGSFTGNSLTVSKGGIYSVTVVDQLGCKGSDTVQINETLNPKPTITGLKSFCEGTSTTLNAGNGFTTYKWSNGTNVAQNIVNSSGNYIVTVTNSAGCSGKDSISVTVLAAPNPSITGKLSFCEGLNTTLNVGNFNTYKWSNGTSNNSITVSNPGNYSITVTNTDGCLGYDTVTVSTLKNPIPIITGNTSLCSGDTAKLSVGNFTSYNWSNSSNLPEIKVVSSGTYTVTVTNSDGCTGTDDISVNFNASLSPDITGKLDICEGQSTLLDAGIGYSSYNWSNGASAQFNQVSTSGTYYVTVTSASGCKGIDSVKVNVLAKPSPAISGNLSICKGETTNITVTSSFAKYEWSDGSTNTSINVTKGGTYIVTVTNAGGCTGTAQVTVVENALPTPTITGNLTICEGATTVLSANTGYAGYSWSTNETTDNITVSKSGNYTVTVSDTNGCRNTKSVTVVVNPNPVPTVGGILSICDGNSTTLSVASTYQNYTWSSGENTFQINVTKAGSYTVTVTDSKGCKGTSSATVNVSDAPKVNISGNAIFCEGSFTDLDAGTGYKSYLWSNGSTESKISVANAGQYSVTVTNDAGCKGVSTINTNTINRPIAKILDDVNEYCPGDTILLSGIGGETFKWTTDNGIIGYSDTSDTYLVTNSNANVKLAVTNLCGSDTASISFTILSSATGGIDKDTISLLKGANVTITATGGGTYSWISPYTLSCKNCSKPLLTPTESTNIYVIITDKNGCKLKDSVFLNVELNLEDIIEVVNTITPNGDGKNDKLILKGLELFENASLTVYNRWGDVVYNNKFNGDKNKIIDDAFDGTKNGLPLPAGTYYYVLKVLDTGKEFKSVLIIVRD